MKVRTPQRPNLSLPKRPTSLRLLQLPKPNRKVMGVLLLLLGVSPLIGAPVVNAVGPIGPDPNDFYPNTNRIELVVSRTSYVNAPTSLIKLYFNAPTGSVTVQNYELCTDPKGSAGNYADDIDGAVPPSGARVTNFEIFNSDHYFVGAQEMETIGTRVFLDYGHSNGANNCKSISYTRTITGMDYSQSTGKYVAYLRATNTANLTQNGFRVVVGTNGYAVGYDASVDASQFAMQHSSPWPGGYSDWSLRFAPDCTLNAPRTEYAYWFDDDNGAAGVQPSPMRFQLRKYPVGSSSYTVQPFISFRTVPGNTPISFSSSGGWYTAYSGSNVKVRAAFTAEPGYRYNWVWDNVYYNNTLQLQLPFDSIFYLTGCQQSDFDLTPNINTLVNGVSSNVAEVGDTIRFNYSVNNTGSTPSNNTACTIYRNTHSGYYQDANPPDTSGSSGSAAGCPRSFPANTNTSLGSATENVVAGTPNQTICRSLYVNPALPAGGSRGDSACVVVASKPYLKVYGGDVSLGSGLETAPATCTNNANATALSWNKRAAGSYAGAGVEYAAYALGAIRDFSTAQNLSGGAAEPAGLSFANTTTNVGVGNFGGSFGSVPCITDYYAQRPASTLPMPANVSSMNTGVYGATGTTTLTGGNVNPGDRISLFVNGDVYINSDIIYEGNWNTSSLPLFQLVARGNIYISGAVNRLDGVFIAQRNGGSGGTIYTCASGATPPTLTNGAFYNSCNSKLTVNGAFIANSVEFLRTHGSQSQSTVGESGAVGTAGEVFNFNPSLWMVQPPQGSGRVDNYDAITSLPPIL